MPEGDTVWLTARRLDERLSGRVLTTADLRVPAHATADLTGREVLSTVSRGKHLLTRIEGGATLHTHLKMEGEWRLMRVGRAPRPGPFVRVVLANTEWVAHGVRLGFVRLLPTSAEPEVVGYLGPDLLGADWSAEEAVRRLLGVPATEIGESLLDQRLLAGIGNLYKAEVLFLTGTNPWTPTRAADVPRIVALVHRLMHANKERWEQVITGDRRSPTYVFERAGRPCRRCGTSIRVASQGPPGRERLTYWCPACQPLRPAAR